MELAVGLSACTISASGLELGGLNYGYWNNLSVGIARNQNAATTQTASITAYQGNVSLNKTESKSVTLNGSAISVAFNNPIKCVKSISNVTDRRGWCINTLSISGNTISLGCSKVDGGNNTITIEVYY